VSGAVFGLMSLGQIFRVVLHWPATIAGYTVPIWVSPIALVLTGSLTLWALRFLRVLARPS
jgi:hypothetical protein